MPPIEAITRIADDRGVGTAENGLLSTLTLSSSSSFRAVLEANTSPSALSANASGTVSLGETNSQVLQEPSDAETPAELVAVLSNMLAPTVVGLLIQNHTADSPRLVSPSGAIQSSEILTTATLALANARQDGETVTVDTPGPTQLGVNLTDIERVVSENETSTVATTTTPVNLLPTGTEGITDGAPHVNHHITRRPFSHIPAQAPVVSNLLPPLGTSGELVLEVPEPVGAVEVQVGLPSTQVGERPSVAGNRIALVAEMGAQLASTTPVDSSTFVQQFHRLSSHLPDTPANSASAPIPLGLPDSTGSEGTLAHRGMNFPGSGLTSASSHWTLGLTDGTTPTSSLFFTDDKAITGGEIPEQALAAVKAHLHQLNQKGETEFRMHLHPPELGSLRIHVSLREGEIHGQLYVLDENVRRFLQDQLPELRQRLEALGLNPGQWEIAPEQSGPQQDTLWSSWHQTEVPTREIPSLWDDRFDHKTDTIGWSPPGSVGDDGVEFKHVDVIV